MPLLSSGNRVFAGFPSLRAWLPGEDEQVHEKEAQSKLSSGQVPGATQCPALSLRGVRQGVPVGAFQAASNLLEGTC